ncbi:P-loop containing nucleoside triphosphate hydrolase protein [Cokeromyces recurvatus]|uniref:P-loop containing nucleoside triphosphate hydrolase protein n=1 Tax=Cokeromyces recurvatus TaxID=90255 RepID=UPI00222048EC|nr:P-loop containing nucleoside triphosphate hydrolase protein [Cokeromyces recurvatus]KAI7903474.1 P-loop containing nucleoside triphosphate hydrolase protein [Cokeromyces recurvatus]
MNFLFGKFSFKGVISNNVRFYSNSKNNDILIHFENAKVHRFGVNNKPAFENLSLTLKKDERWVIVGPVSAGKTTLAETIAGKHEIKPVSAGEWPIVEEKKKNSIYQQQKSLYITDHIHLVSFKENSSTFSYQHHYFQERFNFSDPDHDLLLKDYLGGENEKIKQVAKQLDIDSLLDLSFIKLSNGQTRRARIAKALLKSLSMLVLDEPLMGLDRQHRSYLLNRLGHLAINSSLPIVLTLRPQDEFPSWATHVLELKKLSIEWKGKAEEYLRKRNQEIKRKKEVTIEKKKEERRMNGVDPIVEMKHVQVMYGNKFILRDITWTIQRGERWALLGPNGSGKTTLLSFLTGDHPQAYANDLSLFGRRRGTGESIWEIKQRVSLVSPEIHLYFNPYHTALEAAGTGFFDVLLPRPINEKQTKIIERLFNEFGMTSMLNRRLKDMSTGEQRIILLIRSLVKMPDLIIWDEPFQGLDDTMISNVNDWLEKHLKPEQTFIMVTHHEDEIPSTVTRKLRLGTGGVQVGIE